MTTDKLSCGCSAAKGCGCAWLTSSPTEARTARHTEPSPSTAAGDEEEIGLNAVPGKDLRPAGSLKEITPPEVGELVERLRSYRPLDLEWGNRVHHVICDEAADLLTAQQREIDGLKSAQSGLVSAALAAEQLRLRTVAERDALKAELAKINARRFPIMGDNDCAASIPWAIIATHERQALRNHDQSLERLAERGGLDWTEALAVLEDRRWWQMGEAEARKRVLDLTDNSGTARDIEHQPKAPDHV